MIDLFCDKEQRFDRGGLWFWSYVYYLSKYYELFDTFFLVVKKAC